MLRSEVYYQHSFINGSLYNPLLSLGRFFSFLILYTLGRTPSTGAQPVAGPLYLHNDYKHRINAHTDIHASSRIRTHGPCSSRQLCSDRYQQIDVIFFFSATRRASSSQFVQKGDRFRHKICHLHALGYVNIRVNYTYIEMYAV
jgi:hypothetical protein